MSDLFKMTGTVLSRLLKKPACEMYPVKPARYYPNSRGGIKNDPAVCTLCTVCQMKCPTGAIKVDRKGGTWSINPFKCILCNECVINCKPGSLKMENKHMPPAVSMEVEVLNVQLKTPEKKTDKAE